MNDNAKTPLPNSIGKPALNALSANGFTYLEDIAKLSEKELLSLHGVGPKALRLLKVELSKIK